MSEQVVSYNTLGTLTQDKVDRRVADNTRKSSMPKKLEEALMKSYEKRKKKGKLKGVSKGRYVYGSEMMQEHMKKRGK